MGADIQEGSHLALAVSCHQHWVFSHVGGEKISWVGYLAFVAKKEPAASEDSLQLLLVDARIYKNAAAQQASVGVHQAR